MDPLRAQQLAAELEVEMMADMYNRMTSACHRKCVPPHYKEAELSKGESVCLDRSDESACIPAWWQSARGWAEPRLATKPPTTHFYPPHRLLDLSAFGLCLPLWVFRRGGHCMRNHGKCPGVGSF
uniref:Mitochondrial import inner membrane translocase subunit n=1 Tax=Rhinolophus ferrumequinum TaxID=59479 RepID=A0A671DY50_RHIFE